MTNDDFGGHATPLAPPAASDAPMGASVPSRTPNGPASGAPRRRGIGAIGIWLAVIGGVALVGSGTTAALAATVQSARGGEAVTTAAVDGVQTIDLDVDASDMTVRFAAVDEAELEVENSRGDWTLERDGDELIVHGPRHIFGWFGGAFPGWFARDETVTLTLPDSLAGVDADIDLNAGGLEVTGEFGALQVDVGAGALAIDGSAHSVDAGIDAGRADITVKDVRTADLRVSAGKLVAEFSGRAPDDIVFDVSAGSLDLTVPDEEYDVTGDVSAGDLDNRLETSNRAPRTIDASVSAGSATLRPGD